MEDNSSCHLIKIGKFEYKSKNFWLTVLCILLLFIFLMASLISYTKLKILDKIFPDNSNEVKIENVESVINNT